MSPPNQRPLKLRWIASQSMTSMHALYTLQLGLACGDRKLSEALAEPASELADLLFETGEPRRCWEALLENAPRLENNDELAEFAMSRAGVQLSRQRQLQLAGLIGRGEAVWRTIVPDLVDQLELRSRPIREQWEARGPGLLHVLKRLTEPELIAEQADVVLVYPVLGGGGAAHIRNNCVRLEAVLYHPIAELPEVVRLGWLLSQLQLELPKYSEEIPQHDLRTLAALAMLPATLQAATEVDLAPTIPVEDVLQKWQIFERAREEWVPHLPQIADLLETWWTTYQDNRNAVTWNWSTALGALYQMLTNADRRASLQRGTL